MKDYFGQEISEGDFIVRGGGGNKDGQYAMTLYYVVCAQKCNVIRLGVDFGSRPFGLRLVKSRIRNLKRYLVVTPPPELKKWFFDVRREILETQFQRSYNAREPFDLSPNFNKVLSFISTGELPTEFSS